MRQDDLSEVWRAWPIAGPWRLTALTQGANNLAYRVETPDGEPLVLRVLLNHTDEGQLRAEHALLARLGEAGLPFALPRPVPTREGQSYLRLAPLGEQVRLLVLTPWIAGEPPDRDDAALAESAATALGMLDLALASIELPPDQMRALPNSYRRVRSAARSRASGERPDALARLRDAGVSAEDERRVAALVADLEQQLAPLDAALPQQLIHGDFDPTNVLLEGSRVSGVLDFEFASFDLRLLDLVVALSWWPVAHLGTGAEWPLIDALGRGYFSVVPLTADEVAALPTLLRLRAFGSLLHRIERFTQGLATAEQVRDRVRQTLWREDWLTGNTPRLLRMARGWRGA